MTRRSIADENRSRGVRRDRCQTRHADQNAVANATRRLVVSVSCIQREREYESEEDPPGSPGVTLHPVPVLPPALRGRTDFGTVRMLASEYDKLLAVRIGLTRLLRSGDGW